MKNKKYKNEKSIWNIFTSNELIFIIASIIIIYLFFTVDGCIPTGAGLQKSDWLNFVSATIVFIGTIYVSKVSLNQVNDFNSLEKKRRYDERYERIQPHFSIKIHEIYDPNQKERETIDIAKSFFQHYIELEIKNTGKYPVFNVIIFDNYITHSLVQERKYKYLGLMIIQNIYTSTMKRL